MIGFLKFIMKTFPDVYKRALLSVPQMRAVCQIFISSEIVTDHSLLRPGDQLAVQGYYKGIEYYHHGIFISNEEGVVEFGGNDKKSATVKLVELLKFTNYGKRQLVRIAYPNYMCLPPDVVVENAKKLLKSPQTWGSFNVMLNNCEHFATYCKTCIAQSKQAGKIIIECIFYPPTAIALIL